MIMSGLYTGTVWRDEMNGKSIFVLQTKKALILESMYQRKLVIKDKYGTDEEWYEVKCISLDRPIPSVEKYFPIEVEGYFSAENNFSFIVTNFSLSCNDESVGFRFLASRISEDKAKMIPCKDIYSLKIENLQSYMEKNKAEDILRNLTNKKIECEVVRDMETAKIPYPYVIKAVKAYGAETVKVLKADPYRLLKLGLSFKGCDSLALTYGFSAISTVRLRALSDVVMNRIASAGHTYTPLSEFNTQLSYMLQHGAYTDKITPTTAMLLKSGRYVVEVNEGQKVIIDRKIASAEKRVSHNIARLCNNVREPFKADFIPIIEEKCGMKFGAEQRSAFQMFRTRGIKILTGGPGTGKTTTVKGLIMFYQFMHPDHKIVCAAPTGRAAQRLSESTGLPASTVHKALDFVPYGENASLKDANNPIDADFLILDEVSMLDIQLLDMLLEAVKTTTTILLVGDIHQLESVGAGAILRDLLCTKKKILDTTLLNEVFRQKGGSPIIDNSIMINKGETNLFQTPEFGIIRCNNADLMFQTILSMYKNYRGDMFDIQILCPTYKGEAGIDKLNVAIRDVVNPSGKSLIYGYRSFREGDKIIMIRNNDDVGYYNGDIGKILSISDDGMLIGIRDKIITIQRDNYDDISLAYAITIHRSQGSEFKNVIVALSKEPQNMLVRNLFYTAVTRAKKRIFVVTEQDAMEIAIKTNKSDVRRTRLTEFLDKIF